MREADPVGAYVAAQPESVRDVLVRVRAVIRKALPGAEESITYAIPTYKQGGVAVVYFAAWKAHYAIYPVSDAIRAALADALEGHVLRKDTLRLAYDARVPEGLIARIAKARAKEVREATKPTRARPSATKARRG